MAEEDERTEKGEDGSGNGEEGSGGGGSAARTALTAVAVGAAAAGVAVGIRKLVGALRKDGDSGGNGEEPGASDEEDIVSVLRKTALDVAVAAASAATGYLSSDGDSEGDPED